MDLSVDPCENFYEYTCGKWGEEHPNHGWWSTFSSFTTIAERVAIASLNVLTSDEDVDGQPEALNKSREFYQSCTDQETADELGLTPIYPYLKKSNLPLIPNYITLSQEERDAYVFDWVQSETNIKRIFMMDVFIGVDVGANVYNGTENVIYVGVIFQTCPLPSPVQKKRSKNSIRRKTRSEGSSVHDTLEEEANRNVIKYILKQIAVNVTGETPDDNIIDEAASVILNVTDVVQELVLNYTDPDQEEDDNYSVSFSTLKDLTDSVSSTGRSDFWENYFQQLFAETNVTIDPTKDRLYVTQTDVAYLKSVLKYTYDTPDSHLELYMWWTTVYAMIISTSSEVAEYINKQIDKATGSSEGVVRTRSLECALLANSYMGYAVSYALADQSFPNNTKPKVERMINEMKQAFMNHVYNINWMDWETKRVTLEKCKEMISFVGYPDWLFEDGKLDEYYEDVEIRPDRFLVNMINIIISHNLKKMNSLRKIHKRDWYAEPIEVNAYNSFSDNAINVPMAILNFPMYNLGLEVLNYGSIGTILGHELTHGFDNMGRKHDKYGNTVQWWSNATIETFEKLTECFIKQYDNFTFEGLEEHVKGKATLAENLADNGGIHQAYSAYKSHSKKYGVEPTLPGFEDFTNDQLFFLAYGSIWCETISLEDLKDQIEYDEHSPNLVRVLGTLQNSEDFARAFHCPEGSYMNPRSKCKIW
ncbi:unnamed protein product [Acanthoscelides obtectus]|nr:unnamed protein product [Acanthoscelides obtectus]CAK1646169.1 hypothetical protein AOBTE_LOCUS14490 [Acanthoscelides obtectus]